MNYDTILLEIKNHVAILTLNQPKVLNAISPEMLLEIKDALAFIEQPREEVRCLLVTGSGRGFCAGANLGKAESDKESLPGEKYLEDWPPLFLKLRDLKMPFIAAVKGPVAGVGMSLALSADLVIAGKSTYFLQPFVNVALVPDGGATYILHQLVGKMRAAELSLLGEKLPAQKALEWGMVNRIFEDDELIGEAMIIAERLASGPTITLGLMRKAYWMAPENTYEEHFKLEAEMIGDLSHTEDWEEGFKAFSEKRKPQFKGK